METSLFRFLDAPASADSALDGLRPELAAWFRQSFDEPTWIQRLAWPALAAGGHLLISAPTGGGKTLAALLPVLDNLLSPFTAPGWSDSPLRAIYLAPLKALINDAARTLEGHLRDMAAFLPPGTRLPRLLVRTGDTSAEERRRLFDDPPDLLLTTPESLAVLLSQSASVALFANLVQVVVDEVHALAGNKRGADLSVSLERLTLLSTGEVRRVGLSATAAPLTEAARYLVGANRSCTIVRAPERSGLELTIEPLPAGRRFLSGLVDRLERELPRQRATLVFTNTRALAERLGWSLRRRMPEWNHSIAVHHSALSAPRRREVEGLFKSGRLRAVISSTSLELGIDIGSVDLTVLVHPPGDVVRLLQRVGRAGHSPGAIRRGLVLTASPSELLEAAVTTASGRAGQFEPLRLSSAPLDVLCQQMLGMCCARSCDANEMFNLVRRAACFDDLPRKVFDDCLSYLRGLDQHGETWLPARLAEDGDCWHVRDSRTAKLLRRNLGTILAEQTVPVVLRRPPTAGVEEDDFSSPPPLTIGEVDERFADRLQAGDRFLLDGRCLEYRAREEGAAVVEEVVGRPRTPRWGSDGWPLSSQLAQRLFLLRIQAAEALLEGQSDLLALLESDYGLHGEAAQMLAEYFQGQECVSEIPDANSLLIEVVRAEGGAAYYLHTPLNRPANDALARVAVVRLARDHGRSALSVVADLGFVLQLRRELADVPAIIRQVLSATGFRADLDASLAQSEMLRSRFSRVARTGLMLLRNPEGRRRRVGGPSWPERRLFEQVSAHDPDFVLLRQALNEVRADLCDCDAAEQYLADLPNRAIRCRYLRQPSPFATAWTQPGVVEVGATQTPAEALRRLHAELTQGNGDGRAG
jgi:ATP-dependent Lhr-like helicase